jgi:hypothetical protein
MDIADYFDNTRKWFRAMFWVELSKIPAFFYMFSVYHNHVTEKDIVTLFTFLYSAVEIIVFIGAFSLFFRGVDYLFERYVGVEGFNTDRPRKWLFLTLIFGKCLAVLPELVYLYEQSPGYTDNIGRFNFTLFHSLFVVVSFILVAGISVICWFKIRRFVRLMRDSLLDSEETKTAIREFEESNGQLLFKRRLYRKLAVLSVLPFLFLSFSVDEFDLFSPLFAALLVLIISRLYYKGKTMLALSVLAVVFGSVSLAFSVIFNIKYAYSDVFRTDGAFSFYMCYFIPTLISVVLICAATFIIESRLLDETNLFISSAPFGGHSFYSADLKKRGIAAGVMLVVRSASFIFYKLSLINTEAVKVASFSSVDSYRIYIPVLDWYYYIDLLIAVAAIVCFLVFFSYVKRQYTAAII